MNTEHFHPVQRAGQKQEMISICTLGTLRDEPDYFLEFSHTGSFRVISAFAEGRKYKFSDVKEKRKLDFETEDRETACRFLAELTQKNEVLSVSRKETEKILNITII